MKEAIFGVKNHPLESIAYIIPILLVITAIIDAVIVYALFIANGGYMEQLQYINRYGVLRIFDTFSTGTTSKTIVGPVSNIYGLLLIIECTIIIIKFMKIRGKAMRIAMIVDLSIVGLIFLIPIAFFLYGVTLSFYGLIQTKIFDVSKIINYFKLGFALSLLPLIVPIICFIIFILIEKETRWMIGHTMLALLITYLLIPLIVLILQNALPLGAILLSIFCLVLVIKFFLPEKYTVDDISRLEKERDDAMFEANCYNASANYNRRKGSEGGSLFTSSEEYRNRAQSDSNYADILSEDARDLQRKIDEIKRENGIK